MPLCSFQEDFSIIYMYFNTEIHMFFYLYFGKDLEIEITVTDEKISGLMYQTGIEHIHRWNGCLKMVQVSSEYK